MKYELPVSVVWNVRLFVYAFRLYQYLAELKLFYSSTSSIHSIFTYLLRSASCCNISVTVLCQESSWFVEKIAVKESIHSLFEFQFPCHSWLECTAESLLACKKITCRCKFMSESFSFHFCW